MNPISSPSSSCHSRRSSASGHPSHHDSATPLHYDANDTPDGAPSPTATHAQIIGTESGQSSSPSEPPHQQAPSAAPMDGHESVLRFLLLPSQVAIVLLLEFLNSFRSFGLRFILYNYITNEFGVGDTHAGVLLGVKGYVDIAFGLAGSILVDIHGVRKVSIVALSVAIVGRTLLAFGRSKGALYLAMFFFSPCGEALLSVGLYKVALKKLTTPLTRPLAFAMSYSAFNLAGAFADILIDKMRGGLPDMNIMGGVYTPIRQFVVLTWAIVLITWLIAYCFLEDWTVLDTNDTEDDERPQRQNSSGEPISESESGTYLGGSDGSNMESAKPMIAPHLLRRWFPNHYQSMQHGEFDIEHEEQNDDAAIGRRWPNYKMYRTQFTRGSNTSPCATLMQILHQVGVLLRMRSTWRVLVFGFASFTIAMGWTASEMIMPPFLERRFGEDTPIYTVQSINLIGCLILPPLVGAFTSGREDFSIVMPGLWIMASSPIFVALSPNVTGACLWQVFMTLGEVLWSPRQVSWTSSLAPTGSEGLFFAVSSARSVMGPLADIWMGHINSKFNANCPECRDQYGHFCQTLTKGEDLHCASAQESCDLVLENEQQSCPTTCLECPSWEASNPSTCWWLLMMLSLCTPGRYLVCMFHFFLFALSHLHFCLGVTSLSKSLHLVLPPIPTWKS